MSTLLALILFIVFTIGLNLGMHGIIILHGQSNHDSPSNVDSKVATEKSNTNSASLSRSEPINKLIVDSKMEPNTETLQQTLHTEPVIQIPTETTKEFDRLEQKIRAVENSVILSHPALIDRTYSSRYEKSPVVLLTCNRPQLLSETLKSLLSLRGVIKSNILIVQDGNMGEIVSAAKAADIEIIQNTQGLHLKGGVPLDGAARIAQHYKFALTKAFEYFPSANAIIIVEDDLLFSPDFLEYLTTVAPVLDADPSTFVVSAWNDNGFREKVNKENSLRRTEFFPGLGWLLTRKLYKEELEEKWPTEHWDHWLRSEEIHRNRECIYPQIPRTFHNGVKGTFMDESTHNRYFRDIAYNQNPSVVWRNKSDELSLVLKDSYEARIDGMVKACKHINSVHELVGHYKNEILCLWISISTVENYNFEPLAKFFGIWHEHKRGNHVGLHEFYWDSNYLLLLNIHSKYLDSNGVKHNYRTMLPSNAQVFTKDNFDMNLLAKLKLQRVANKLYKATSTDMSCDKVCSDQGLSCQASMMDEANTCVALKNHFPCKECVGSIGSEQPAYVTPDAPDDKMPGTCLFNQQVHKVPILCSASHRDTYRLCVCG